ncbi:MAG TPA: carboxypeptidase regulatory-like domain-containing protein [Polyangiaceae bacterium]|nr:carboxypeptidase regulatory-like domain-containing protein [Polyangiaceae bacterium]
MTQTTQPTKCHPSCKPHTWQLLVGLLLLGVTFTTLATQTAWASTGSRLPHLTSFDVTLRTLTAAPDQDEYVVPKNVASAVRIVVKSGDKVLTTEEVAQQLGGAFSVNAELSGPGLDRVITLPSLGPSDPPPVDPLLLPLPALATAGDYQVKNIRFVRSGQSVLDVSPAEVAVKFIDQVLVTSVTTRPLTLDEILERGIVLDGDDYLAFEFTIGMATGSESVNFAMPVIFDRQGVPVPQPISPPADPPRLGVNIEAPAPMLIPSLLTPSPEQMAEVPELALRLPDGRPIQIPSVLVIPGNVGYLKQFFSAQLFVANGAPAGSGLTLHEVTGTVKLPPGADLDPGTADDPLALPETIRGVQPKTMGIRGLGFDGEPGTADDTARFRPGEQGQAEFLIRGEQEGFHSLEFDVEATLEGLPVGPVTVTGKARGGVLVRNPFFDMTFTIPSVVRQGETFSVFATVNNIGQGIANDVNVTLDASALAGAVLVGEGTQHVDTLRSGDSKTLEYRFLAQRTGQVLATYLKFDTQAPGGGQLKFTLGVGERGVALSPDTLVLPSGVDELPPSVVSAAMRVLGQAWSIANAPTGTLPPEVLRISRSATTTKALALAEAGLRVRFGQAYDAALRDLAFDFYGGATLDLGFDQLLRQTQAGHDFARALGAALGNAAAAAGGALQLGKQVDHVAISGQDFVRVAIGSGANGVPASVALVDGGNRRTEAQAVAGALPRSEIASGVWLPLGNASGPLLGLVPVAGSALYRLELAGTGTGSTDLSVTLPRGGGTFVRGTVTGVPLAAASRARLVLDLRDPGSLLLESDLEGDGTYESSRFLATEVLESTGPELISATVVGPETVDGASPLGFHTAVLFDRIVDPASAAVVANYAIPKNAVQSASAQLSGRLVFASLQQPEGPYIRTTFRAAGVRDQRGHPGAASTVSLGALLDAPGAVVSGRVIGPDGQPVTSGTVTYENNANWQCAGDQAIQPAGFATARLDASGRYEFRFVRQDQCGYPWAMLTSDPRTGSLRRVTGFVRAAGEQIVLDIALLGQGTVSGFVRNLQGQAVPSAQVTVVSQTDPQVGAATVSDGDGFYQVSGITVGTVSVSAVKGTGVGRAAGSIARAGGSATVAVTIDSGAGSVSGRVFSEEGPIISTVPGITVVFETDGLPIAVTTTDSDGDYRFDGVPAGPFRVKAALNARDRDEAAGVLAAGAPLKNVDLVIVIPVPGEPPQGGPGYGTVRGFVRYADGSPAPAAIVSVGDRGLLSAADGSFELFGVAVRPNQPQSVLARSRDGLRSGSASFTLNTNGQITPPITIALSGLGSAEFTVLSASGAPVVGQQVGLLDRCTAACGCAPETTNAQGKVTFHDLPLGAVHAHAVRSGQSFVDVASASASITQDGQVATGTLRFGGSGVVSGVVKNPNGQPVFGAEVALSSPYFNADYCGLVGGVSQTMRTDSLGRFRFQAVNLGSISVTASQAFFPNPTTRSGALTQDGQELVFEIPLQEGESTIAGVLEGNIYLPDGVTPAGAGVEVAASGLLPDVVVRTDASGHYRFAKIFPEGSYTLSVSDPITGGLARTGVYLRRAQDQLQHVRLLGRGTVLVRVVDANDAPVSNAFVRLRETSFPNRDFEGSADAANQGVVRFDNVFEGPISTEVSDVFGRGGRASDTLPGPGATLEVKVRLSITGSVSGVFLAADGTTPVPFGQITLVSNGRVLGQTTTGGAGELLGKFRFDNVPAGPVRVEAQDPATARTGFAVGTITGQDQVVALTVRAQGLGSVEGLVLSNGSPQAGAEVTVAAASFRATTSSDANGRYRVTGVPEGQVTASANLGGGFLAGSASGNLNGDGTTLTLDVPLQDSGAVGGVVVRADGTTPAPTSNVTLSVNGSSYSTVTAANGRFLFERLPAGSASLSVDVLGSIDQGSSSVQIPAGGTAEVKIALNGVGAIRGVARTSNGTPTAGTVVLSSAGAIPYSFTLSAGANGVFSLPEVLAGPFTASLTVVTPTFTLFGTASGTVVAGQETNLDVKVQPSGLVRGRVLRASGAPALGTEIALKLLPNRGNLTLYADESGAFETAGVPLGAFELAFRDPFSAGVAQLVGLSLTSDGEIADVGDVLLDETPVEAVAFAPLDGSLGVAINQPLRITFSDRLSSSDGILVQADSEVLAATRSLSADGLTVTLNGTWRDSREITVTATTNVTDVFGRHPAAAKSARFRTVDLSGPRVLSVTPLNGAIEVASDASVEVLFDEPLGSTTDFSTLIVVAGSEGAVPGAVERTAAARARFTPTLALAENSTFVVSVSGAIDVTGNAQTTAFSSTFRTHDTHAPVLALTQPQAPWVATDKPTIVFGLSDSLSGVDAATSTLSIDGAAVSPARSSSALSYTPSAPLGQGVHGLVATVEDLAGNLGTLAAELRIDTEPPSAPTFAGVGDGDVLIGAVPFSGAATDGGSGVERIQVSSDGALLTTLFSPDFSGALPSLSLAEGPHALIGKAVDRAGNVSPASAPFSVVVNNVPLTVALTTPAAGARFRELVTVSASVSEPVAQVVFAVGAETVTDVTPPYSATLSLATLPEGAATVTATATGLLGELALGARDIVVDRSAPPAPNAALVFAEPPDAGRSFVHGEASSVEAGALVTARNTNPARPSTGIATAQGNGSFGLQLLADVDDVISLTATDAAGNVSEPVAVTVRATTTLPPEPAVLSFNGISVDRVGATALTPDGIRDALFGVQFSMPPTTTRQLAFIELQGPRTLSTRPEDQAPLGVSGRDLGSPFLNDADGQVTTSITGNGSLLLFAPAAAFVAANTSYRVTVAFTNGSRFIGVAAIGKLPTEEVASAAFTVQNQYVPIPGGGGEPGGADPLQPTDFVGRVFSLFNQEFPNTAVVNAPGGGHPTDVVGPPFSVRNDRLPFQNVLSVPGGGYATETTGPLFSLFNRQMPFATLTAGLGGLHPTDVNGGVFSLFNEKLPFEALASVNGGFQPTEVGGPSFSVNNDASAFIAQAVAANGLAQQLRILGVDDATSETTSGPLLPTVFFTDASAAESAGFAEIRAFLSEASFTTVSIDYALERASLTPESEYEPVNGTLTFAPGELEKTISVPLFDDSLHEQDESLFVTFSHPVGVALLADEALVTVEDDESGPAPRAALFDDFEQEDLDSRWQVTPGGVDARGGLLELAGHELQSADAFGPETGGVTLSARLRFSAPGERFGFNPTASALVGSAAYYFEAFTPDAPDAALGVRIVAEFLDDQATPIRVLEQTFDLDPGAFADFSIERTPEAVAFAVDGVELASLPDAVQDELTVGLIRSGAASGPECDWLQVVVVDAEARGCVAAPSDVVAWWPGDGDSRDVFAGLASSTQASYARGRVGQAFSFAAGRPALATWASESSAQQAFSLSMWVRPALIDGNARTLLARREAPSSVPAYLLELDGSNHVRFKVWNGTVQTTLTSEVALLSGGWHHLAATREAKQLTLFVDGAETTHVAFDGAVLYGTSTTAELQLGSTRNGAEPELAELLDEIMIYGRGLSAAEVQQIYQAGSAGYCLP